MAIASPLDTLRRSAPPDGSGRPPALMRRWKSGHTKSLDEALRLVGDVYGIPPFDRALRYGRLSTLVGAGWLVGQDFDPFGREFAAFRRPDEDPKPRAEEPPRQMQYRYPFSRTRYATVKTQDGQIARVPVGTEEVPGGWFYMDGTPVPPHQRPIGGEPRF